ncbi:MAG: efflux RND transporter periplasmic adaptor subunit, partial [Planctomycetota bacterium]
MKRWLPQIFASLALIAIGWFLHSLSSGENTGPTRSRGTMSQSDRGGPNRGGASGYGIVTAKQQEIVPVEVTSSLLAVIRERIRSSGILEPEREVTLLSRVEGTVDSVMVEEGAQVKDGNILCAIDQEELRIATQVSEIELKQAKASLDRLEGLAETRSATGQEVENARFAFQKAKASHDRALIDLGHSQPKALFDGVIIRRRIEPGQYVRVGDELFAFADFEPLRVRLYLPESEVVDVEKGQRCVLRTESDGPILAEGTISRISPVVDRESLTVEILVSFPDAAVRLRPGSFVHVDIITRILDNRIVIPRKALVDSEGRSIVFRLLEDGETVQEIEVVPGYE